MRGLTGCYSFSLIRNAVNQGLSLLGEVGRQLPLHAATQLSGSLRIGLLIGIKQLIPLLLPAGTTSGCIPVLIDRSRNFKGCMGPVNRLARGSNLVLTQRGPMRLGRACQCGCPLTDHGATANQGRPQILAGLLTGQSECRSNGLGIMTIYISNDLPAIPTTTCWRITTNHRLEQGSMGNHIVIIQNDELG